MRNQRESCSEHSNLVSYLQVFIEILAQKRDMAINAANLGLFLWPRGKTLFVLANFRYSGVIEYGELEYDLHFHVGHVHVQHLVQRLPRGGRQCLFWPILGTQGFSYMGNPNLTSTFMLDMSMYNILYNTYQDGENKPRIDQFSLLRGFRIWRIQI
jgi:hypothetical protein